jgi:hypothetical protein
MEVTPRVRHALLGALVLLMPLTSAARAQSDGGDVRFAIMGNRDMDGTISGETVEVHVPWEGVNTVDQAVACLVGPFQLRSDGPEERAQIGPDAAVLLRLRLDSDDEGTWEVLQARGRCASLGGAGSFRRTIWADGAVSYRFIGEAHINGAASSS